MDVLSKRTTSLVIGPILLVGICYVLAGPKPRAAAKDAGELAGRRSGTQQLGSRPLPLDGAAAAAAVPGSANQPRMSGSGLRVDDAALKARCEQAAEALQKDLPGDWAVVVHTPFVLGGDLPAAQLGRLAEQIIDPTVRALQVAYFDRAPQDPITILMLSTAATFQACQRRFEGRAHAEYSGLYSREHRRLVINISTGEGTLAHELTHALAHVDFPDMPEWFDEGLASLYEECAFSDDGRKLVGLENWRRQLVQSAFTAGSLPDLSAFLDRRFARENPALDYAMARSLCLFLQERELLTCFYRKCRTNVDVDPCGAYSLCDILSTGDLREVDQEFRDWLRKGGRRFTSK